MSASCDTLLVIEDPTALPPVVLPPGPRGSEVGNINTLRLCGGGVFGLDLPCIHKTIQTTFVNHTFIVASAV